MKPICLSVACALVLVPFSTQAVDEPAIVIKDSGSPDGRKDLVIVAADEDPGLAAGTAKIRDVKTGRILGSFPWQGFGVRPDEEAFEVLWRPDSRAFAIKWELTRGFVVCAAYLWSGLGWKEVKLPNFYARSLRLAHAVGPDHVFIDEDMGGKGHEIPLTWLPGNRLRIETGYRGIEALDIGDDWHQLFWFTLGIPKTATKPKLKAVIKELRLAPRSAYRSS